MPIKLAGRFAGVERRDPEGLLNNTDHHYWLRAAIGVVASAVVPALVLAQASTRPDARPVIQAHALSSSPVLDGEVLDDPAWEGTVPATGFWQTQPNDGFPAT